MRILAVRANNFRSYASLDWVLPATGLFLIDGCNPDTGRSNMAGKTTLIDSIAFGLFGYLPKWGGPKGGPIDAVVRRGQEFCRVEVTVEHAGKRIRVVRERPARLSVIVDGKKQEGKISDLDARIPELVGMTAAQFLLSVYISQDRGTSFFSMSDTDRTKILSVISGLEDLNRALEKAKQAKSDLQSQSERVSGAIGAFKSQLVRIAPERDALILRQAGAARAYQELQSSMGSLSAANEELLRTCEQGYREELESIESALQGELEAFRAKQKEVEAKKSELAASLQAAPDVEKELVSALSKATDALAAARALEASRQKTEARNQMIFEQVERKLHELQSLKDPTHTSCPTCLQTLPQSQIETAAEKILGELRSLEARIESVPDKVDITPLEAAAADAARRVAERRAELQSGPSRVQAEIRSLDTELTSLSTAIRSVQNEATSAKRALEAEYQENVRKIKAELIDLGHRLQLSKRELDLGEKQAEHLRIEENKVLEDLLLAESELKQIGREMDVVLDLVDLFGPKGFRAVCFEGLIARISDRAGELFAAMTDGSYSTRLDQTSETAKGEERIVLRPAITKGGLEVPLDDLSGGARRMAMLAYDISVAESVGDSSALFLDEALDGLDPIGKSEALRALEKVALTRAVFVVDHTSEIRSAVQDVLLVEYRDGVSTLLSNSEVSALRS